MTTKHKYAVGQKVLFNDQIHTVIDSAGEGYYRVEDRDGTFGTVHEDELLPLIKESDGKVYGSTKPKATRPRKKVFSTDKSGK
jgi:hypothetical protein